MFNAVIFSTLLIVAVPTVMHFICQTLKFYKGWDLFLKDHGNINEIHKEDCLESVKGKLADAGKSGVVQMHMNDSLI